MPANPVTIVRPSAALSIFEKDFCIWVGHAEPGTKLEYHRGFLSSDRVRGMSAFGEKARRELGAIADRAQRLAAEGRLILTQERHGDGDYSYYAAKPMKVSGRRS